MDLKGKIHQIELVNFKSYKGHQVIGPFYDFTAIIGPNGSGKSNLMDAISFVLGVRANQLRGEQLKDLIYADKGRCGDASVKLFYRRVNGTDIVFSRTVVDSGRSVYRIDKKVESWESYNAVLKSCGILVKARNFLVFQGDVESVVSKNPKDLTVFFEQISGSYEDKKEYEDLEVKKGQAYEEFGRANQKKKTIALEKKEKKAQKEEAEKHMDLQKELKSLKKKHFSWQLSNIKNDLEKANEEIKAEESSLHKIQKELDGHRKESGKKEKEQAEYKKKVEKREKELAEKKNESDKNQSDLLKLKEEKTRLNAKLENVGKELVKKNDDKKKHTAETTKLKNAFDDLTKEVNGLQSKGRSKGGKLHLTADGLDAYNLAGIEATKLRDEKEVQDRVQNADLEAQKNLIENLQQLESRNQELESRQKQMETALEKIVEAINKHKDELEHLRLEHSDTLKKLVDFEKEYELLKLQISGFENQLRELEVDKRKDDRDTKLLQEVEDLKKLFHGVYGCLRDLWWSTKANGDLAVAVGMSRFMDAVVIDTDNTGEKCIKYLRDQKRPPMTFIPLQSVRVESTYKEPRDPSTTKLLDVIRCDESYNKAIQFAVGSTLLCNNFDEAKYLSWTPERCTVVTADGILLTKAGTMTGGTSDGIEASLQKRDDTNTEALKKEKEELEAQLQELGSKVSEMRLKVSEVTKKISLVEETIKYEETEKKNAEVKVGNLNSELSNVKGEIGTMQADVYKIEGIISSRSTNISSLEKEINDIYKSIRVSAGFDEDEHLVAKQLAEERLSLCNQQSAVKNQLEYEEKRDVEAPITKLLTSQTELKKKLDNVNQKEKELESVIEKATKEIETSKNELKVWKSWLEVCDGEMKKWNVEISAATTNITLHKDKKKAKNDQIEQLNKKRKDILGKCTSEKITFADDGMDDGSVPGPTSPVMDPSTRDVQEEDFKEQIRNKTSIIDGIAPNLKAKDQYIEICKKHKEATTEFTKAKEEMDRIDADFQKTRTRRVAQFSEAFNLISGNIGKIYKELTKSSKYPTGGSAYLIRDNEDEPYLEGIRYTVMPPSKPFRDMEYLSGGEKALAALALLFSIQSYKQSPFFILDEVDAALDNSNVANVARYIRSKSRERERDGFQSIVITHKDSFYDKADLLVGVYRLPKRGRSRTLTFDLTKYPESEVV